MDNPYYEQDKEDLERFRSGLPPLKRKEVIVTDIVTPAEVSKQALEIFRGKAN